MCIIASVEYKQKKFEKGNVHQMVVISVATTKFCVVQFVVQTLPALLGYCKF